MRYAPPKIPVKWAFFGSDALSTFVQPPVFGPPFKLVSGDAFSAPSAVLPKVQEVDNSELNVV